MVNTDKEQDTLRRAALGVAAVIAMAAAGHAQAANCEMQMSTSRFDYGQLSRTELDAQKPEAGGVSLGRRTATLNITCEQPTTMVLRFDAPSAASGTFVFAERGNYVMKISEAHLDGSAVALGRISAPGQVPQAAKMSETFESGEGVGLVTDGRPARGRHLTAQIEIETRVPSEALRVRSETQLTGQGQLQLIER
ncbi:hypothetical protein FAZ95_23840 [Trinickia violacea]|uniref:DUF1120 domain-containing protein n=1 Tax=Trinickia violacea TaxID=2571746 RepID=A0A4P8IWD9_9BURK|nr:hypothetical protein [Trinickia violacea]QCP52215.1 hypothetical protein FAZ95_23840 [Trinickia violacea]